LSKHLMERIDEIIEIKSLLKHPFYQAWTMGTLPLSSLERYAEQYFHFEAAYPTFLSGLHHRCADPSIRQMILDNLWDEEHGDENHIELWLRFCDRLGLDRSSMLNGKMVAATANLINSYRDMTSSGSIASGAAALYAFESQVPAVAKEKIDGLGRFYGIEDERSVSFFRVHQILDEAHSSTEREMVGSLAKKEDAYEEVVETVDRAVTILWEFLDGVYQA